MSIYERITLFIDVVEHSGTENIDAKELQDLLFDARDAIKQTEEDEYGKNTVALFALFGLVFMLAIVATAGFFVGVHTN
jgi:hypothetical protein